MSSLHAARPHPHLVQPWRTRRVRRCSADDGQDRAGYTWHRIASGTRCAPSTACAAPCAPNASDDAAAAEAGTRRHRGILCGCRSLLTRHTAHPDAPKVPGHDGAAGASATRPIARAT